MKSNTVDDFNFLLDEFFVYQGLDDLEKNSIKQDYKLDSMMQTCYQLLNEIKKIKSKIKISSIVKKYSYNPNKNRNNSQLKRKSLGNTEINNSNHIYFNKILSEGNIEQSKNNISLSYLKKNKIINLKKQYSISKQNNIINPVKINSISEQNMKYRNKIIEKKRYRKKYMRQFTVSLLD